ncbi:hypothetical protein APASM_6632 [Actinosynnema pretiosum subsp. pretiosum]|nr:hypothetical protein APASM_6632 [Actinosynnema pretiosum subsp. pretiosum]
MVAVVDGAVSGVGRFPTTAPRDRLPGSALSEVRFTSA